MKILIDSNGIVCRFAFATDFAPDGFSIGGVLGFCNLLLSLPNDCEVICLFDKCSKNFRKTIDPTYKANREHFFNIGYQTGLAMQICENSNILVDYHAEYEADDLIASYIKEGNSYKIITTDKDLLQLVSDNVVVYNPFIKKNYYRDDVKEKFGVFPEYLKYFLALCGDSSDNIKGIEKIGPKTAAKIINSLSSWDINMIKQLYPKYDFTNFELYLSLVELCHNVPLKHTQFNKINKDLLNQNLKILC